MSTPRSQPQPPQLLPLDALLTAAAAANRHRPALVRRRHRRSRSRSRAMARTSKVLFDRMAAASTMACEADIDVVGDGNSGDGGSGGGGSAIDAAAASNGANCTRRRARRHDDTAAATERGALVAHPAADSAAASRPSARRATSTGPATAAASAAGTIKPTAMDAAPERRRAMQYGIQTGTTLRLTLGAPSAPCIAACVQLRRQSAEWPHRSACFELDIRMLRDHDRGASRERNDFVASAATGSGQTVILGTSLCDKRTQCPQRPVCRAGTQRCAACAQHAADAYTESATVELCCAPSAPPVLHCPDALDFVVTLYARPLPPTLPSSSQPASASADGVDRNGDKNRLVRRDASKTDGARDARVVRRQFVAQAAVLGSELLARARCQQRLGHGAPNKFGTIRRALIGDTHRVVGEFVCDFLVIEPYRGEMIARALRAAAAAEAAAAAAAQTVTPTISSDAPPPDGDGSVSLLPTTVGVTKETSVGSWDTMSVGSVLSDDDGDNDSYGDSGDSNDDKESCAHGGCGTNHVPRSCSPPSRQRQQQQQWCRPLSNTAPIHATGTKYDRHRTGAQFGCGSMLIGHRGAGKRGTAALQENTMLSFLAATRSADVGAIELDVHLTRDGVPVVHHDYLFDADPEDDDGDGENDMGEVENNSDQDDNAAAAAANVADGDDADYEIAHGVLGTPRVNVGDENLLRAPIEETAPRRRHADRGGGDERGANVASRAVQRARAIFSMTCAEWRRAATYRPCLAAERDSDADVRVHLTERGYSSDGDNGAAPRMTRAHIARAPRLPAPGAPSAPLVRRHTSSASVSSVSSCDSDGGSASGHGGSCWVRAHDTGAVRGDPGDAGDGENCNGVHDHVGGNDRADGNDDDADADGVKHALARGAHTDSCDAPAYRLHRARAPTSTHTRPARRVHDDSALDGAAASPAPSMPQRCRPKQSRRRFVVRDDMPTLARVLRELPSHVHVLVEIKYPVAAVANRLHLPYPERNHFVDRVLDVAFRHAPRHRAASAAPAHPRLSFLSFDPDVCLLLRRKQRAFRVFLLNSENRDPTEATPRDPRRSSAGGGLRFAAENRLAGVVLLSEIILEWPELVRAAHAWYRLAVLCYGGKNSVPACARRLLHTGVDGIIADRVGRVACALAEDLAARRR